MAAIRGPNGSEQAQVDQRILQRANTIYNIGYVPDMSAEERLQVLDEYRRALRIYPLWVIEQAFDAAAREIPRRPTPGELSILADRAKRPIVDEIARRRKETDRQEAERAERAAARVSAEDSTRMCHAAGFTPKRMEAVRAAPMASSFAEAEAKAFEPPRPHWTETASPEALAQLQAERDANPLVIAARADRARRAAQTKDGEAA